MNSNANKNYILGLLNSNVSQNILNCIAPTLNYQAGDISLIPVIFNKSFNNVLKNNISNNILLCKNDWNDYETSWGFKTHPLLKFKNNEIEENFEEWAEYKTNDFKQLKLNEIELNRIYSEIYNVDFDNAIDDKQISIKLADVTEDIKSFISYAVGCMFGRYSLDNKGLQFAGGEFNINNYDKSIIDDDNIIPVLDTAYFEDDIVGKFVEFVKTCFGEEHLEENLYFISNALSKNKKPSREKIRNYMLKNFFNDHKKTYKKRPVYWQFSSGNENGFNCLIYMHRYEPSLVARVRTDYLHKTQKAIEQRIVNIDNILSNSTSTSEKSKASKEKVKLQKQLKETLEYDELLANIANQNIEIDLDNGVKFNYELFQDIEIKKEGKKYKKLNLLKKI